MKKVLGLVLIFSSYAKLTLSDNDNSLQKTENVQPTFIVKPAEVKKGASKNDIKEDIGETIKTSLNSCTELMKNIAEVQIELSKIQAQLHSNVESLIDNKAPYKNASRNNLKQSLGMMQRLNKELSSQCHLVRQLKTEMNNDKCLKVS